MSSALSIARVFKFAAQNITRNVWLSFVTVTVFVLTLLTINVVILVNVLASATLGSIERRVEVAIYFNADVSEGIVTSAQGYLQGLTQVREARYISAEEALENFKIRFENDPVILASLEEVGGNPFGPSLVVSAQSPDDFPFILEAIETPEYAPFIRQKAFDDDIERTIENIRMWSGRIRATGLALSAFFAAIAVSIIFNTIRVAIYVHRDEIGIMKLVGANDWFVRGPFLLESIFYSVFATALVVGLMAAFLSVFGAQMSQFFGDAGSGISDYFLENGILIFGAQLIGLMTLSVLTTLIAMRRYLRV